MTVSKPGEKADVPVGVIVGSVIGGLLLLAAVVGLLYKVNSFRYCIVFKLRNTSNGLCGGWQNCLRLVNYLCCPLLCKKN